MGYCSLAEMVILVHNQKNIEKITWTILFILKIIEINIQTVIDELIITSCILEQNQYIDIDYSSTIQIKYF